MLFVFVPAAEVLGMARTTVSWLVNAPGTMPVVALGTCVLLLPEAAAVTRTRRRSRSKLSFSVTESENFVVGDHLKSVFSAMLCCFRLLALSQVW